VVTKTVPVEVPVQVPILPPVEILQDCQAPALPVAPPTYGEVLQILQQQDTALAQCQAAIEAIRKWRNSLDDSP